MRVILKGIFILLLSSILICLPFFTSSFPTYSIENDLNIVQRPPIEEEIINQLTLEEKVGQLFVFGFSGTNTYGYIGGDIKEKHIGGVLLLGKNISSNEQLKTLNHDLQELSTIPLFISIDQEGGTVARIKGSDTLTLAQKNMDTPQKTFDIAKDRGLLLKELGINVNFAPVVEYITNTSSFLYQRVFRGSIEDVAIKGDNAIKGYTQSGIIGVAKHYPGHSNSSIDSHYGLPRVYIEEKDINSYIYPFKYLIEQGNVDMIMVGHILYPNIDRNPSTVSNILLTEKLRNEQKYDGVLITDDMEMDSIESIGEYCEVAKMSLNAGMDILLYSGLPQVQNTVYECILNAVKSNEISENTINDKVKRVLRLKAKYNLVTYSTLQQLLER